MGYDRIELNYPLDCHEVVEMMEKHGQKCDFQEAPQKTTQGRPDPENKHYSLRDWTGKVRLGTDSGPRRKVPVKVGISDYEHFGKKGAKGKDSQRRQDHRHFWAQGNDQAVLAIMDIFKATIPFQLWHDEVIPTTVHDCKQWAPPETG